MATLIEKARIHRLKQLSDEIHDFKDRKLNPALALQLQKLKQERQALMENNIRLVDDCS